MRNVAADPVEVQRQLAHEVHAGDAVELALLHRLPEGEDQTPPYAVLHDGRPVGEVSEAFRRALHLMLSRGGSWSEYNVPCRITGLHIDCVETVAGSDIATERAGLGSSGAWLAPRLSGLGRFDWTDPSDDSNTERLPS